MREILKRNTALNYTTAIQNGTETNEIYGNKNTELKNKMSNPVNPMKIIHAPQGILKDQAMKKMDSSSI